jgi:hypothetical protein
MKTLAKFPRVGRKVPEFDDENIRELLYTAIGLSTDSRKMQ